MKFSVVKSFEIKLLIITALCFIPRLSALQAGNSDIYSANKTIQVDPFARYQTLDGWGGSLCWWANVMGGYSDEKVKMICDWITNPVTGLNMNIFRFNIGGGDAPGHNHMRTDGGAMPGYKDAPDMPYNWTNDRNQCKIMKQLIASRIANTGRNDLKIIGFSNSPPWWMTVSGCVSGSVDGVTTNLKPEMFDDFADYLTDVTRYYHDSLGITFDHIDPFNEPFSNWWTANKKGGQEGCYFTQTDQQRMIQILYDKLQEKNMLNYCRIAAMDANSIDEAYHGLLGYESVGNVLDKIDRIDVHSYAGTKRKEISDFAARHAKTLWQSESGPLYVGGTDEHQMMVVAERIITDLREMKCTAWLDWQLANDRSPLWGMIVGTYSDPLQPVTKGPSFYIRAQFSRYLKPGYTLINSTLPNTIAAISPDEKELVLIVVNKKTKEEKFLIDLSKMNANGKIQQIITSVHTSSLKNNEVTTLKCSGSRFKYNAVPQSVTTFIISQNH